MPAAVTLSPEKTLLRTEVLARRRSSDPEAARPKSVQAQRLVLDCPEWNAARVVGLYAPLASEVATLLLWEEARRSGKLACFPRLLEGERALSFAPAVDESELVPGPSRSREPTAKAIDPRELDLVIVPGAAFDASGGRLGLGGGHYDATLEGPARRAIRLGLCFELQLVTRVPCAATDARMDLLATEVRLLRFPSARSDTGR